METTTTRTPENNSDRLRYTPLARRLGEIAKKAATTGAVTGSIIAAGFAGNHLTSDASAERDDASKDIYSAETGLLVESTDTFEEGDGGTAVAQRVIEKGIESALLNMQPGREFTPEEASAIAAELPKLEQAQELFETANKNDILPDAGDELSAKLFVTAEMDGTVRYEVQSSELKDFDNN